MLIQTFKKDEIKTVKPVRALVYGQTGIGKSYFALKISQNPLVLDFENRISHLNQHFPFNRIDCSSYALIEQVITQSKEIMKFITDNNVDALIIDSVTALYNTLQIGKMGIKENVALNIWGIIKRLHKFLLIICFETGLPLIFLAQAKKDESGNFIYDCEKSVSYEMDVIAEMKIDTQNGTRFFKIDKDSVLDKPLNSTLNYEDFAGYFDNYRNYLIDRIEKAGKVNGKKHGNLKDKTTVELKKILNEEIKDYKTKDKVPFGKSVSEIIDKDAPF